VLTCGVDSLVLPEDLPELLMPAPAFLAAQPVIGLWPAIAATTVEDILHSEGPHSLKRFTAEIGARAVKAGAEPANINTQADLAALERRHGL
jgi:molybdenum cofactor guanylyltransferase